MVNPAGPPLTLLMVGLFLWSFRSEPRRWRNGVFLLIALWSAASMSTEWLAARLNRQPEAELFVVSLPWSSAFVLGLLLIANGAVMTRREARTTGNLLSLAAGAGTVLMIMGGISLLILGSMPWRVAGLVLLMLPGFAAFSGLSYLLFCLVYTRRTPRPRPAAVVILGSGLIAGGVPPLLARRLDTAIAWQQRMTHQGHRPTMVPSGGQGDDEPQPEGTAMAEYLIAHGVSGDTVLVEDRATTTEQNLRYSLDLLGPVKDQILVVTSNYHVGRAALLTQALGIPADVAGAPTAGYFLPSAFLREWVAAIAQYRRTHLWTGAIWLVSTAAWCILIVIG